MLPTGHLADEAAVGQGYSHKFNLNLLGADSAYLNCISMQFKSHQIRMRLLPMTFHLEILLIALTRMCFAQNEKNNDEIPILELYGLSTKASQKYKKLHMLL